MVSHVTQAPEEGSGLPPGGARRGRQIAIVALACLLVILLGVSLIVGAVVMTAHESLGRVDVDGLRDSSTPDREVVDRRGGGVGTGAEGHDVQRGGESLSGRRLEEPKTLLLVGMDSREGLTDEQLQELGTEDHGGDLTDGLMLVRLDPEGQGATVLSLPRDLLVTRCDGSRGKINSAYAIGEQDGAGPSCVVQTVANLTGVAIDHYVQVNLAGFIDVVDALGGVEMYLDEPLQDPAAGLDLPEGCVKLDGQQALAFARARKSLDGGSDLGRIARQQRLLREIVQEAADADTLANVPELFSVVAAAGRAVETDSDLSLNVVRRLVLTFRGVEADDVAMFTVPASEDSSGAGSYLVPNDESEEVFERFADGTLGEEPARRTGSTSQPQAGGANAGGGDGSEPATATDDEVQSTEPPAGSSASGGSC